MTSATGSRRTALRAALALVLTLAAATAAAPAASEPQTAAGTLGFQLGLRQSGPLTVLHDPGAPAHVPWAGSGVVRGLGKVAVSYEWLFALGPPVCPADLAKRLTTVARLAIAGKGTIDVTFADGARCVSFEARWPDLWYEPQAFTITGGTGRFASATGYGTRVAGPIVSGAPGTETWMGLLEVPGVAFDLTAPKLKLRGTGSKAVLARHGATSARVAFEAAATDDVDGAVPVSCRPRSGSRFALGPTRVRCEATDSSGNTARTTFMVAVHRR